MFEGLRIEWHYSGPILIKLEFSEPIFEKESNIKFDENPCSRRRVVPCGQTEERTDMKKPIDVFCNFVEAAKNFRNLRRNMRLWTSEQDSGRNSRICASYSGISVHNSTPIPGTLTANVHIFSQNLQANVRKIGWAQSIPSFPLVDCLLVFQGSQTELQTTSLYRVSHSLTNSAFL
jgi:hypothetical protein